MEITKAHREQAETTASAAQLSLYDSPESGEALWSIATKFNLTEQKAYYTFTKMVGDVVLGFYKQQDLLALIQNLLPSLNPMQQLELELEIKKFLLPLSAPQPHTQPSTVVDLTEELAQTERELESIQGLRTMAQDMHEVQGHAEPVYQSSQSEILNRTIPSVPPQTAGPHWDTEQ